MAKQEQQRQTLHNQIMRHAEEWAEYRGNDWKEDWLNGIVYGLIYAYQWMFLNDGHDAFDEYMAMLRPHEGVKPDETQ